MLKKISCLLAIMVFLFAGSMETSAENRTLGERNNSDPLGSITIELADTEDGTPKDNVKFSITKVAALENGEFLILDEYKDSGIDLNNIETAEALSLASEKLSKVVKEGVEIVTDKDGKESLEDLELGAYFICSKEASKYGNIIPSIVSIPTWSEAEGNMIYDITVTPKYTPILTAIQVNKVDSITKEPVISKDFLFGLYADKECTKLIKTENADQETGTATFKDLRYGTYYVKELEAPKGYQLSDEVKEITINNDLEGVGDIHSFIYENVLLPATTVQTGDNTGVLALMMMLIISLSCIGFIFFTKRKKHDYEE